MSRFARRIGGNAIDRVRQRGRTALFRALRLTGTALASYLAAEALHTSDQPLLAPLTALIVVQVTLFSTLTSGLQRVLSVVAGVAIAVLFASVVGLTWWSLAAMIAASIVVGQLLRLGPQLIEVPISAMVVLGVGGTEIAAAGRIAETLVGAAVGVIVNLAFPPAVQSRSAGDAVDRFAEEIAELLDRAADEIDLGPPADLALRWLEDARRLNRHVSRVDRALVDAEESRKLNPRALGTPKAGITLRGGLDALEHCSVALRSMFRSIYDAARTNPEGEYAQQVWQATATLLRDLATVIKAFGHVVREEVDSSELPAETQLAAALKTLRADRERLNPLLLADPREQPVLWELNGSVLATVERVLSELDVTEHASLREKRLREAAARPRPVQAVDRLAVTTRQLADRPRRRRRGSPPPDSG